MPPVELITVLMVDSEWVRLRAARGCTGTGGAQKLIHRLREGLRGKQLTVRVSDLPKILKTWQWKYKGCRGHGTFQKMMPIQSLREYLPTIAPLFADTAVAVKTPTRWVYFRVRAVEPSGRIKIGGTYTRKRRDMERSTDNADRLVTLLKLKERPGCTEVDLHHRFAHWRIPGGEWFWFAEAIHNFINEESSKSEL